jgi:hypothetical protein
MSVKTKERNLLLSDKSKKYPQTGSLTVEITTTAVIKKINVDLNEMILYTDEVDEFLNYIDEHNLSVFLPNENFFTVFHIVLSGSRSSLLKKFRQYIELNEAENTSFEKNVFLIEKFKTNVQEDTLPFERDSIIKIYSNLMEIASPRKAYDQETSENIEFITQKLSEIGNKVMDEIFKP